MNGYTVFLQENRMCRMDVSAYDRDGSLTFRNVITKNGERYGDTIPQLSPA